mmetsp:Transcript_6323/g.16872  ORF Transcript_6323/g.16872 Transcript_6323/m.16872 type:complete len:240 (+) Transcript_6323:1177-1896(+)
MLRTPAANASGLMPARQQRVSDSHHTLMFSAEDSAAELAHCSSLSQRLHSERLPRQRFTEPSAAQYWYGRAQSASEVHLACALASSTLRNEGLTQIFAMAPQTSAPAQSSSAAHSSPYSSSPAPRSAGWQQPRLPNPLQRNPCVQSASFKQLGKQLGSKLSWQKPLEHESVCGITYLPQLSVISNAAHCSTAARTQSSREAHGSCRDATHTPGSFWIISSTLEDSVTNSLALCGSRRMQ